MMQKAWLTLGSEAGTLHMSSATKSKEKEFGTREH